MSLFSTDAFVLSTLRLGEADKLVTFFTLTRGKFAGVAKGARRFKNSFGASLEPFTQCHLVAFEKGPNKLARIRQTGIVHSFQKLRDQWETIVLGTRMVRLILRMTPEEEPHPELYDLLQKGFAFLETGVDRSLSFLLFMIHLMAACGYQLQWAFCARCGPRREGDRVRGPMDRGTEDSLGRALSREPLRVSYPEGGILCPHCKGIATRSLSKEAFDFLQSVAKTDFVSAHDRSLSMRARREVETLLKDHIAYILGKAIWDEAMP